MERAYDGQVHRDGQGRVLGVVLGADATTEHEVGIRGIRDAFHMDSTLTGPARRKVRFCPSTLMWVSGTSEVYENGETRPVDYAGFCLKGSRRIPQGTEIRFTKDTVYSAWDDRSLMMVSRNPEEIRALREVYEALRSCNAFLWCGRGFIIGAGPVIVIADRVPEEELQAWEQADQERIRLEALFKESGIEQTLKSAGQKWFFLGSPSMIGDELRLWLNPWHQDIHNAGWYTVAELELWAKNEGPVIRKPDPPPPNKSKRRRKEMS